MFFVAEIFLTIAYYQFFKSDWITTNHGLFFQGKHPMQHPFSILKIKSISSSIVIRKNIFLFKIILMVLITKNYTFNIGNSKAVKNIFPGKISNSLWKFNYF